MPIADACAPWADAPHHGFPVGQACMSLHRTCYALRFEAGLCVHQQAEGYVILFVRGLYTVVMRHHAPDPLIPLPLYLPQIKEYRYQGLEQLLRDHRDHRFTLGLRAARDLAIKYYLRTHWPPAMLRDPGDTELRLRCCEQLRLHFDVSPRMSELILLSYLQTQPHEPAEQASGASDPDAEAMTLQQAEAVESSPKIGRETVRMGRVHVA